MPPRLSIVIPAHNCAAYLPDAVRSVVAQTMPDWELLIIDDGSTDDSLATARALARSDRRIRVAAEPHGGAARATNVGIRMAEGAFVARLDADDELTADRFEMQFAWLAGRDVDVSGSQVEEFGASNRWLWFPESPDAVRNELFFRPAIAHPALMAREIAAAYPYDVASTFNDYELLTRLASRYVLANMPVVGLRFRRHPGQLHTVARERTQAEFRRSRFRYFYDRFPDTPLADYLPLARLSDREPMATLEEWDRAGQWLIDLSQPEETGLRRRMAKRWRDAWLRSSHLGADGEAIYAAYLARLEALVSAAESTARP